MTLALTERAQPSEDVTAAKSMLKTSLRSDWPYLGSSGEPTSQCSGDDPTGPGPGSGGADEAPLASTPPILAPTRLVSPLSSHASLLDFGVKCGVRQTEVGSPRSPRCAPVAQAGSGTVIHGGSYPKR